MGWQGRVAASILRPGSARCIGRNDTLVTVQVGEPAREGLDSVPDDKAGSTKGATSGACRKKLLLVTPVTPCRTSGR
jgi:hypothetical protein